MLEPARPDDETERLAELCSLQILDTQCEERFDRITRTAQRLFNVPIVLISLVDSERQWFKSRIGLDVTQTPRKTSFCGHAILGDTPLIVENALLDVRFSDNPLVTGEPGIRFYAGQPLKGPHGKNLGTLCLIDRVEHTFGAHEIAALKDLAVIAENELHAIHLQDAISMVRDSAAKTGAIVDHVVDGIFTFDESGTIETVNSAAIAIFGYSKQQLIGGNLRMLLCDWNEAQGAATIDQFFQGVENGKYRTITGRRIDGSPFPLELVINEMLLKDRKCFVAIARDISERQNIEKQVRETALLLQSIMDSTTSYVHVRDLAGRFLYVNNEYEKVFQFSKEDLIGKTLEEVFPPLLAQKYRSQENAVIQSRQVARTEAVVEQFDGPHTYLVMRSPLFNEAGEVYGACGVGTDITRHKQDENALRQLNRQLAATTAVQQAILNSANFAIIASGIDGTVRIFSAGAERLLGYSAAEMIGSHTPIILHDQAEVEERAKALRIELQRPITAGFETLIAKTLDGAADDHEWTYICKNGARLPVMLSTTALVDEHQHISGFLGVAYDLTERKKIESMKNEFISTVSHELRTPLTSIHGSLGLLSAGTVGDLAPAAKSLLDIATNNCQRLVRLVNDILDIEKIESGNMRFNMLRQRLIPLLEQAISAMHAYGRQFEVDFILHRGSDNGIDGIEVMGDADRLIQVVFNLLSNASKFSPAGSTVEISVVQRGSMVRVTISDHGEGIPDAFKSTIFQKFSQADSSDSKQKGGTGLGLSISKAIMEKHDGTIGFVTEEGVGTKFYFELPVISRLSDYEDGNNSSAINLPCHLHAHILICECEPETAALLELMLAQGGFSSKIAADAVQARSLLAQGHFDAMTLELRLPGEDGMSLLSWLRQHPPTQDLPVVIVSAEKASATSSRKSGIADWIGKPVDADKLLAALRLIALNTKKAYPKLLQVGVDPDSIAEAIQQLSAVYEVHEASSLSQACLHLSAESYDMILLDLNLGNDNGSDLLATMPELNADTPVVIFSADQSPQIIFENVQAALDKSRTSNTQLVATLHDLIQRNVHSQSFRNSR